MKILILHNYYQRRGGEDECVEQEAELLRQHGHIVRVRTIHNDEIKDYSVWRKASLFLTPTWSSKSYKQISEIARTFKPDIAHVHNFFPLFSPAVHVACSKLGIPVIQTLHNYRLIAPCALLSRDGGVCERCVNGSLWNGIALRCYRNSAIQTASVALMIKTHRVFRTWDRHVDTFIALTPFMKDKFADSGMDVSRFVVRPNYLMSDPGNGVSCRAGALFIGRLSEEKGIRSLLEAWRKLPSEMELTLIGDGPLTNWTHGYISSNKLQNVDQVGWLPQDEVLQRLKEARFFVLPSVCYEGFPRTVVEAFATGTPALVSGHGSVGSVVTPEVTGLHFAPGDANDLAAKAQYMFDHPEEAAEWGRNARAEYLEKYTAESAYRSLMDVYRSAIEQRKKRK